MRADVGTDEDGPPFVLTGDAEPSPERAAGGVTDVVSRVTEELPGTPIVVRGTELAAGDDAGDRRVAQLRAILHALEGAIDSGADVRGYFHWTAIDGYELDGGFGIKRGLWDRDRNPRASAELLPPRNEHDAPRHPAAFEPSRTRDD